MTRHTASSITDAQLDALYAELRITESLRANADYHLGREMARSRRAEQRTEEQRARAEQAEAELEQYATGMAGPVRWSVYNEMHGRALSAEGNLKDAEERAEQADFRTKLWIAQAQDNAKEAIDAQQRAEQAEAALDRIRDAARLHRQGLIDTELYAVIEAHTTPPPAASGTQPTEPCTDPRHTGRIREQLGCVGPDPAATEATDTELTADEARNLVSELGIDLYRAQDALAFVSECCDIADHEQRPVTTTNVREWLKGVRCGRQLAVDTAATEATETPTRYVHVVISNPSEFTTNRSALCIADHLRAEFADSIAMDITTDAHEMTDSATRAAVAINTGGPFVEYVPGPAAAEATEQQPCAHESWEVVGEYRTDAGWLKSRKCNDCWEDLAPVVEAEPHWDLQPAPAPVVVTDREAIRNTDEPDPRPEPLPEFIEISTYSDYPSGRSWAARCNGAGTCPGWIALDLGSKDAAEQDAHRHLAEAHALAEPDPRAEAEQPCGTAPHGPHTWGPSQSRHCPGIPTPHRDAPEAEPACDTCGHGRTRHHTSTGCRVCACRRIYLPPIEHP